MSDDSSARESSLKDELSGSSFLTLRTPLLPFEQILEWGSGTRAAAVSKPEDLQAALSADRRELRGRLREVMSRPCVKEALFIASPDLASRYDLWADEPESSRGRAMEAAIVRYFMRMAGRATPFGLFAGCSVGRVGTGTRFVLEGHGSYERHTRLDMGYLCALVAALERAPEVRETLLFRPNSSLYQAAGKLHYAETRLDGQNRSYRSIAVEKTDYLAATLVRARHGASAATLATALQADPDVSQEEAQEYIGELIESQILVSDLMPPVTGLEPIHVLVDTLRGHARTAPVGDALDEVRARLSRLDRARLGADPEDYRLIEKLLEPLPAKVDRKSLFQVDMVKPASQAMVGGECLVEILKGVELLHHLWVPEREEPLARFVGAFADRYEGREVPLLEALDGEVGIGLAEAPAAEVSSVLDGLAMSPPRAEPSAAWGRRQAFLLDKLLDAASSGKQEVVLEEPDLEKIRTRDPLPLPRAFSVVAAVAARSLEALVARDFRVFVQYAEGPPGVRFLGRFCHTDPAIRELVQEHLRAEEAHSPSAVFAEIVHLPEGRPGNILLRPILREHEIPYLGRSGAAPDRQILVTDLRVSIHEGRIVLRSERLGREVIPRLTNAHNYVFGNVRLYRFLCELQRRGTTSAMTWSWGPLESASFLPRLSMGRLVLSRARWLLAKSEIKRLTSGGDTERYREMQALRARRGLPRFVMLAEGDHELPVDLENVLSAEAFLDVARKKDRARLFEMFPEPSELIVEGPEGRFVHELVVHCVREPRVSGVTPALHSRPDTQAQRSFPPGSEWLYAKLYSGPATADRILREVVAPVVREGEGRGMLDRWFFIRYSDPDRHIRLRLHGEAGTLLREVLPALTSRMRSLLGNGGIWRVQMDTYERETERYGGEEGMLLAERLFHHDSQAVLSIVETLAGDEASVARWHLGLRGIHDLFEDLEFDLRTRLMLLKSLRAVFGKEFATGKVLKIQLGEKYRKERSGLEAILRASPENGALAPGVAALRQRSERFRPVITELKRAEEGGRLCRPLHDFAGSLVHMHANRLLRSAQRAQEFVLYDFLVRLYVSRVERSDSLVRSRTDPHTRGGLP